MNIYVGNLSFDATDETLRQAFEAFGQVTSATVAKDKYSGQSRGFGFVEMPIGTQAQTAIKSLNGKELMGREIKVEQAHDSAAGEELGGERRVAVAGIVIKGFAWSASSRCSYPRRIHDGQESLRSKPPSPGNRS